MATGINLFKQATSASVDSSHSRLQVDANGVLNLINSSGTAFPVGEFYLCTAIPDLSSAPDAFIAAPEAGTWTDLKTCIANAITGADAAVTAEIEDVAVTGIAITVTQSGSAAGDVDTDTSTGANTVAENDALEVLTDAGSTTACVTECTITIERRA